MKIYEIGTGYTSIPAKISAATELVVEELTKSMLSQKIDVKIIDIKDSNRLKTNLPIIEVSIPKVFNSTDVQLGIMHKLKRVIYSISLTKKIHKILKSENEKIVLHFHNQYNSYFFLKLTSKKLREKCFVVYTNHSGIWSNNLNEIKGILKKKYFQETYSMKNVDIVFVLNNNMKKNILNYCNLRDKKIHVIANGVNEQIYKPLDIDKQKKIKEKLGFLDKKIILQVGSIYENKGQIRSIECLSNLLKENNKLMYIFVGGIVSQEYYNKIFEKAKELGIESKVKYLGMIRPGKDLCELYNVADYTILSSRYEAFGLVGIESLSCGIPVLIHEITALNFGKGSIKLNKNNVEKLFDKNLKKVKENARKNVIDNYTWDAVSKKYIIEIEKYKIEKE